MKATKAILQGYHAEMTLFYKCRLFYSCDCFTFAKILFIYKTLKEKPHGLSGTSWDYLKLTMWYPVRGSNPQSREAEGF